MFDIPTTLTALAGVNMSGTSDGFDVWKTIASGAPSPRQEVPVNVDTSLLPKVLSLAVDGLLDGFRNDMALIQGKWKLIEGVKGIYDGWSTNDPYTIVPPEAKDNYQKVHGHHVWLFDIEADPQERQNLATRHPDIVMKMVNRLKELSSPKNGYLDPQYNFPHPRAFPFLHNGTWAPFFKEDEEQESLVV